MRDIIVEALTFPFRGKTPLNRLLAGGVIGTVLVVLFLVAAFLLSLIETAAVPVILLAPFANFPGLGYCLLIVRQALRGEEAQLPAWEGRPVLFLEGLLLFGVGLGYSLLPLLLIMIGFGLFLRGDVVLLIGLGVVLLGVLAGVLVGFFLPIGVVRYAAEGRVEAAFHPGLLLRWIEPVLGSYVIAYLLSITALVLAGIVAMIIDRVMPLKPYLGAVVWPFEVFYLLVMSARLFGRVSAVPFQTTALTLERMKVTRESGGSPEA